MKHQVTVKELSTTRTIRSVSDHRNDARHRKDLMAQTNAPAVVKKVVRVHGGFVDGSGWEGVYKALKKNGYAVAIVRNPTISLADDVAVTKRAIAAQNGLVILVSHSYGGSWSPKPAMTRRSLAWSISQRLRRTRPNRCRR
jgi:pimeloyl-ACP methyl ester carboxylesterase